MFLYFLFLFLANADQFIVLKSPKSLEFKGNSALSTETIQDVYASSLGYSVTPSPGIRFSQTRM